MRKMFLLIALAGCSQADDDGEPTGQEGEFSDEVVEVPVEPEEGQVLGEPADVMTEPGRYDGYTVYAEDCGVTNGFPVSATGEVDFRSYKLNDELEQRLRSLPAYHGWPTFSGACERFSTIVRLNDWRAVDEAIEIAGAFLVELDINGIVVVKVTPRGEE